MQSQKTSLPDQPGSLLLSIIICTYNRSKLLRICLESLVAQNGNYGPYEIIVVDNNSEDDTQRFVSAFAEKFFNLRYTQEKRQGLSHARNKGCRVAQGAYLAYLDDDAKVAKNYIVNLQRVIEEYQPDIMGGPIYPFYLSTRPRWFKDRYEIREFASQSGFSTTCRISGGNFIIRKDTLIKLGYFDVNLGMKGKKIGLGEERALLDHYRKTTPKSDQKVYYAMQCAIEHYVPPYKMHRRYMARRSFQIGCTAFRIKGKNPASALSRIVHYIPDQIAYAHKEIRINGLKDADYIDIMMHMALRAGTIAGAFSYGLEPVLKPHLRQRYNQLRLWGHKIRIPQVMCWFKRKMGNRV
jgi:glycosyltransferase involved in cell wall biosynthesis